MELLFYVEGEKCVNWKWVFFRLVVCLPLYILKACQKGYIIDYDILSIVSRGHSKAALVRIEERRLCKCLEKWLKLLTW